MMITSGGQAYQTALPRALVRGAVAGEQGYWTVIRRGVGLVG